MKTLVCYFTAEKGRTEALAKCVAEKASADLFEIEPAEKYSTADLNYLNPLSRCNKEKMGGKDVAVKACPDQFDQYEMVLIGFPIWYAAAPNIVNTFCKGLDFAGKKVAVFATSGGSKIGKTAEKLASYVKGAEIADAVLLNDASEEEVARWIKSLNK